MTPPSIPASRSLPPLCSILFLGFALFSLPPPIAQQDASSPTIWSIGGAQFEITLPDEELDVSSKELLAWVNAAAVAVSEYYGHFPVPHLTLRIRATGGSGIRHGVTYPTNGGLILISVGRDTPPEDLITDWTLTHEMTHLAFPNMADNQHWLEEGIATYVEPIARAQAGQLSASEVWRDFIRGMPKGEPKPGDKGLDHTHTWDRTYWGGALFCLLADVQIRELTHNKKGLQDALRAIPGHGGSINEDWAIEKALSIADQATATTVLQDLYVQMRDQPFPVNLPQLWEKLGLSLKDGDVLFNDQAPDAPIRQSITSPHR